VIQLKGGHQTQDPRLDRVPQFDEQSRRYPVSSIIRRAAVPRSYTWRLTTTLDQGQEGACVGFGWAHEMLARPAEGTGITDVYARVRLYWEAQKIDPWEGGSYPGARPFYEGTSVLAGAKVVKAAGGMDEYRWAFGLDDLVGALGYAGPAVLGLNWYEGMFEPVDGYIRPTGELAGGHCILCRGVSVTRRRFLLHNSWGPGWGLNGTCWITFDDMATLLAEDGEACIPVRRHRIAA
jgi:hypothetical protein